MSIELIISLVKANIVLAVLLTNTILLIWFERKVVAGMQSREAEGQGYSGNISKPSPATFSIF